MKKRFFWKEKIEVQLFIEDASGVPYHTAQWIVMIQTE